MQQALDQCLQDLAQEINQRPQNASLDLATLEVTPGYPGRELEQTASREKLLRNIVDPGFSEMSLVVK
ncbi:MAG: peptidoglycan binding domain-containing protein [bacterium]